VNQYATIGHELTHLRQNNGAGQGVRFGRMTGDFITFVEGSLAKW